MNKRSDYTNSEKIEYFKLQVKTFENKIEILKLRIKQLEMSQDWDSSLQRDLDAKKAPK